MDKELEVMVANGEVTTSEIERVWENTRDLPAQTTLQARRAVLLMRHAGSLDRAWPIFMKEMVSQMSVVQAAITKDESKFAHLVAHTEDFLALAKDSSRIVAEIQNFRSTVDRFEGRLTETLEPIEESLDAVDGSMRDVLQRLAELERRDRYRPSLWQRIRARFTRA